MSYRAVRPFRPGLWIADQQGRIGDTCPLPRTRFPKPRLHLIVKESQEDPRPLTHRSIWALFQVRGYAIAPPSRCGPVRADLPARPAEIVYPDIQSAPGLAG
jgi:hypothetical protein